MKKNIFLPVISVFLFSTLISLTFMSSCREREKNNSYAYTIVRSDIVVDANTDDWHSIKGIEVADTSKLWIGQGMRKEYWKGRDDLSFRWKAAYKDNKTYFLFEVSDDTFVDPAQQPLSWLNDVIEIMLDPENTKNERFVFHNGKKKLRGYEMHFLPSSGHEVFLDDSMIPEYNLKLSQDSLFKHIWQGEIASKKHGDGYVLELGFEVPGMNITPGKEIGLDVDVCDDDGQGRKSLLIWSGENNRFWLTMEKYPTVVFK